MVKWVGLIRPRLKKMDFFFNILYMYKWRLSSLHNITLTMTHVHPAIQRFPLSPSMLNQYQYQSMLHVNLFEVWFSMNICFSPHPQRLLSRSFRTSLPRLFLLHPSLLSTVSFLNKWCSPQIHYCFVHFSLFFTVKYLVTVQQGKEVRRIQMNDRLL